MLDVGERDVVEFVVMRLAIACMDLSVGTETYKQKKKKNVFPNDPHKMTKYYITNESRCRTTVQKRVNSDLEDFPPNRR